jgi:hypothetical protein
MVGESTLVVGEYLEPGPVVVAAGASWAAALRVSVAGPWDRGNVDNG